METVAARQQQQQQLQLQQQQLLYLQQPQQQHQQQHQRATTPYSWCRKRMLHSSTAGGDAAQAHAHLVPQPQPQSQPQAAYYSNPGLLEDKYGGAECYRYTPPTAPDYPFDYCPLSPYCSSIGGGGYGRAAPACANERGDDAAGSFANGAIASAAVAPRHSTRRLMTPLLPDEELKTMLQSFLADRVAPDSNTASAGHQQSPSAQSVDSGCFEDYSSSASSSCGAFTPLAQWPSPPAAAEMTHHGSPYASHDSLRSVFPCSTGHASVGPPPHSHPHAHPHDGDAFYPIPMCAGHVPHVDLPLASADSLRPSASNEDLYSIVDQVFTSMSKQFAEDEQLQLRSCLSPEEQERPDGARAALALRTERTAAMTTASASTDSRLSVAEVDVDRSGGRQWQEAAANRGNGDFDCCGQDTSTTMLCDNCGTLVAGEACERCGRLLLAVNEQPEQPQQSEATERFASSTSQTISAPNPKERLVAVTRPLQHASVAPTTSSAKPRTVGVVEPRVVVKIPRSLLRDAPSSPLLSEKDLRETCSIKSIPSPIDVDDYDDAGVPRSDGKRRACESVESVDKGRSHCDVGGERKSKRRRRRSREEAEAEAEAVRVTETLPEHFRAALLRRATALLDWAGVAAVDTGTSTSQKKEKRRRRRLQQEQHRAEDGDGDGSLASTHRKSFSPKRRRVDESDRGRARRSQTDARHERRGDEDEVAPRTRVNPLKLIRRFAPETNQSEYYAVDCRQQNPSPSRSQSQRGDNDDDVPVVDLDSEDESDALRGASDRVTSYLRQRMPLLHVSVVKPECAEEASRPCSVVLSRLTDEQIEEFAGSDSCFSSSSSSRSESPLAFAAYKDMKGFGDLAAANGACVPANGHAGRRPHRKGRGRRKERKEKERCGFEGKISEKPTSVERESSSDENGFLIQRDKAKKGENENSGSNIGSRTNPSIQSHSHMLEHAANTEYASELSEAMQKKLRLAAITQEVNDNDSDSDRSPEHASSIDLDLPDLDLNPEDLCESSRSDTRNDDFALITPGPDAANSESESDSFASENTPSESHEDSMGLSMPILFSEDDADFNDLANILTDVPLDTQNNEGSCEEADTPSASSEDGASDTGSGCSADDANSVESSNTREQTSPSGDDEEIVCLTPSTAPPQPTPVKQHERESAAEALLLTKRGKARFRCGDASKDSAKWLVCATSGCRFGTRFLDRWRRHALCHVAGSAGLRCVDCLRRFHTLEALLRHEKKDHGGKKYECKICEIETSDLKKHMLIHKPSKDLTCSFCGVSFRYKNSLKRHTFTQHREERSIVCQVCEAPVPNVAKLREHIARKHPNAPASVWKMDGPHAHHAQAVSGFRPIAPKGPPAPTILQSAAGATTLSLATGPNGMLYLISNPAPAQPSYLVTNPAGQLQLIQPQPQPQPYFLSSVPQPTQFFSTGALLPQMAQMSQPLLLPSSGDLACVTPTPTPGSVASVLSPRDVAMLSVPTPEVPTPEPSSEPLLDLPNVMQQQEVLDAGGDAYSLVSVNGASTESVSVRANDGTELARMDILERAILEIPDLDQLSALDSSEGRHDHATGSRAQSNGANSISSESGWSSGEDPCDSSHSSERGDFVCSRCGHRTHFVHFHKVHVKNCLARAAKQEKGEKMRPG